MLQSFVEVQAGGVGLPTPSSTLIVQGEKAHDVATFVLAASVATGVREAMPVIIRWGAKNGAQQTFYGYVHTAEPLYTTDQPMGRIKVACIGASWSLMSGLQRSWRSQSLDTIVREVATEAYLSADVEPHDTVWPYIAANTTAWEFLLELAGKINYTLAVNGTEVRFLSIAEVLRRGMPAAPILSTDMFRPVMGAATEAGRKAQHLGFGLDPRSGRMFSVTGGDPSGFLELDTDVVADSPGAAALQVVPKRFIHRANAEASGNANVTQASVVYVPNVGADYAGHWYVHQVEHEIQAKGEYRMYLQLGKDSRGAYAPSAPQGKGIRVRTDPYGEVTGNAPPTILTSGVWRSGWARRAS